MEAVNKTDIAELVHLRNDVSKRLVYSIVNDTIDVIRETLLAGERVRLNGFGTFEVVECKRKWATSISTGERFEIPSCKRVRFRVSRKLAGDVKK